MTLTSDHNVASDGQTSAPLELELDLQISEQSSSLSYGNPRLSGNASTAGMSCKNTSPDHLFAPTESSDAGLSEFSSRDDTQISVHMAKRGKESSQQETPYELDEVECSTTEHQEFEDINEIEAGGPIQGELNGHAQGSAQLQLDELQEKLSVGGGAANFEYDPIESSEAEAAGYCKLDFKPFQIKTWFLVMTIVFFSICMAGIVAVLLWGRRVGDSYHVDKSSDALAFRYVPAAIGALTVIWWQNIASNYARMNPYILMAAKQAASDDCRSRNRKGQRTLNGFYDVLIEPTFLGLEAFAVHGHWLLIANSFVLNIARIFLVGLKAAFIQTTPTADGWSIRVSGDIAYALVTMYSLLITMTLTILVWLYNRDTGLKWDPVSIADQLALLQSPDVRALFANLETCSYAEPRMTIKTRALDFGALRLGYWKERRDQKIWHGIAFTQKAQAVRSDGAQAHSETRSRSRPSRSNSNHSQEYSDRSKESEHAAPHINAYHPNEEPVDMKGASIPDIETFRHRSCNENLYDTILLIYAIVAILVLTLVVLGLINGHLENGIHMSAASINNFLPHVNRREALTDGTEAFQISTPHTFWTTPDPFNNYNIVEGFLFRFLPVTLMGPWFASLWYNADFFYRHTEAFANMDSAAPACSNILLDYPSSMPVLVTVKAACNSHWRVALFSLLSLTAPVAPIVASGIFVGTSDATGFTEHIQPGAFWTSFSILIIYLLCIPFARPTPAYRLPRRIRTIIETAQFCYASRLFEEECHGTPIFSILDATDERIHLISRIHLAKRNFQFGLYLGKDGRRHLGFDVAERQNASGKLEYVDKIDAGRAIYFWGGRRRFFCKPRIVRKHE